MLKAMRPEAVDVCVAGGQVIDVRTGAAHRAAVGIRGDRIVAIGPDETIAPAARTVIDASGRTVVPGYIEPHGHAILANPVEFAQVLAARGTTTAVVDSLPLMLLARPDRLAELLQTLAALPVKLRWLIRLHPQSFAETGDRFSLPVLRALWQLPCVAGVGEVTRWFDVVAGDEDLRAKIRAARADGKRVEGHAAGASYERLAALAAAGVTSCHEAVTADEIRDRLRAGLVAMLRHSSIRPDLPELLKALVHDDVLAGRVMLTADGPTPAFIEEHGYLDYLLDLAIRGGTPPVEALRMVTVNPAQYFGFDDVGEIAAGKRADLNVIQDLAHPTPLLVVADGKVVAADHRLTAPFQAPRWAAVYEPLRIPTPPAPALVPAGPASPGIKLTSDVITEPVSPADVPPTALHAALLDRRGQWITTSRVIGMADRLGGLATTISSGFDVVVLGQHPADMGAALARLAALGGGLVVMERGKEVFSFPLELGAFSLRPWAEVAAANRRFNALMRDHGYRFSDPIFSLLFLTFDSLPWVRLTGRGVWDVRHRKILAPSVPL